MNDANTSKVSITVIVIQPQCGFKACPPNFTNTYLGAKLWFQPVGSHIVSPLSNSETGILQAPYSCYPRIQDHKLFLLFSRPAHSTDFTVHIMVLYFVKSVSGSPSARTKEEYSTLVFTKKILRTTQTQPLATFTLIKEIILSILSIKKRMW